jgi:predicted DCC family thiol-disulfide oxidoreductase YuxK
MTTAIYDSRCVLCQQTRRTVKALDWLKRVEFLDIHEWETVVARVPDLEYEAAMGQIHVLADNGDLLGGFPAMRRLLRDLPLGVPFWLMFHLPGMNWLGPKVYAFIARHRYRINRFFGVDICDDGVCQVHG